jgi:glycosyltransferase involved in cell wall biosynthesis
VAHTLSVISVTFNEAAHVQRLLDSIRGLRRNADVTLECIVVDGGSSDGTPEAAREAGFDQVMVLPGANIPVCRNRGLAAAAGDWIAFIDGDCELAPDWLDQARPLLECGETVLVGWPAAPPEPMTWVQAAWRFHWLQKNSRVDLFHGRRVVRQEGFRLATTRNMVLHRAVVDRVQGFNEELSTGEDTDFAYRAYLAGVVVLGCPDLKVIHHGEPRTFGQFFRQQVWHANRKSYEHIMKATGGKVGGNAPRYAAAFLAASLLAVGGLLGTLITEHGSLLFLSLPLLALIAGPAALMSWRGETWRHFLPLCAIYAAYGAARAWDLAGLARAKPSWKSP